MPEDPNKQSVFMPQQPTMEGPFSQYLQPAPPPQRPQPHTAPNTSGGLAYIAQSFLDGVTRAKQQAFVMEEKKHNDKLRGIISAWSPILNAPNAAPETKQMAQNKINEASMIAFEDAAGKGSKGKKSKGVEAPSGPNVPGGPEHGPASTFRNILGEVYKGFKGRYEKATGGPLPTFKDLDPAKAHAEVMSTYYEPNPDGGYKLKEQYTIQGKVKPLLNQLDEQVEGLQAKGASREQAEPDLRQTIEKIRKYDPGVAAAAEAKIGEFYPYASLPWTRQQAELKHKQATGPNASAATSTGPATTPPPTPQGTQFKGGVTSARDAHALPNVPGPAPGLPTPGSAPPPTAAGPHAPPEGWDQDLANAYLSNPDAIKSKLVESKSVRISDPSNPKAGSIRRWADHVRLPGMPPVWMLDGVPLFGYNVEQTSTTEPAGHIVHAGDGKFFWADSSDPHNPEFKEIKGITGPDLVAHQKVMEQHAANMEKIADKRVALSQARLARTASKEDNKAVDDLVKDYRARVKTIRLQTTSRAESIMADTGGARPDKKQREAARDEVLALGAQLEARESEEFQSAMSAYQEAKAPVKPLGDQSKFFQRNK